MGVPSGMPTTRIAKLVYADNLVITSTTGILQDYVFRANSIFDPDLTGVGHQPMGHDQWQGLFQHYAVLGSRISCSWNDGGTANTQSVAVGTYLSAVNTTAYTDTATFIEAGKGMVRNYTGRAVRPVSTAANFSAKKFFNVSDVKDNIDRLGALMGANPQEDALFHVFAQARSGGTESLNLTVKIEYIVLFSEPKNLGPS